MTKVGVAAAGFGILTGTWSIAGDYFHTFGYACYVQNCVHNSIADTLVLSLSILLVIGSLLGLVGPRKVFYASALLSALLGVYVFVISVPTVFPLTAVGLAGVTFVLSIVAARWETRVSEQSHPMNLPVFG